MTIIRELLDDLKDRRGYSHLKEEALDRTVWRNRFGGGFGPVVRQNTEWMNVYQLIHLLVLEGIQIYIKIRSNMLLHVSVYDHHQGATG